jgi:hypothetical protein
MPVSSRSAELFSAPARLAEERPAYLLADKRYDSIRASLRGAGIRSCVPPKSTRKAKICWNMRMYRERNRIERMICHLEDQPRYRNAIRQARPTERPHLA